MELFLMTCFVLIYFVFFVFAISQTVNDEFKLLCVGLESIIKRYEERDGINLETNSSDVEQFFYTYYQKSNNIRKRYSSVNDWLDEVIMRINIKSSKKYVKNLYPYYEQIVSIRNCINKQRPFNKCSEYQQRILADIKETENSENQTVIRNIIERTKEEFLKLSSDVKKNDQLNKISIAIGVIGIVVSILMAIFKFN